jgi:tripartite-type tricarboxylate transporter receptor subunit TctC
MRPARRGLLGAAILAAPSLACGGGFSREATPTLLVGAAPGSAADAWTRGFAPFLERHWPGSRVAVANRPGQGGLAAARAIADASPGAWLIGSVSTPQLLARSIAAEEPGLVDRLAFVAAVVEEPPLLVAAAGGPADLAAVHRLGRQAVLGLPPHGSAAQLAGIQLATALPLAPLVFAHAAAARQAVLAGSIACAMLAAPEAILALRDGRLRGLGVARAQRSPLLPEIPTLAEQGLPLQLAARRGFILPAAAGPRCRTLLQAALQAAVEDPEFSAQGDAQGRSPDFLPQPAWEAELQRGMIVLTARWTGWPWLNRRP